MAPRKDKMEQKNKSEKSKKSEKKKDAPVMVSTGSGLPPTAANKAAINAISVSAEVQQNQTSCSESTIQHVKSTALVSAPLVPVTSDAPAALTPVWATQSTEVVPENSLSSILPSEILDGQYQIVEFIDQAGATSVSDLVHIMEQGFVNIQAQFRESAAVLIKDPQVITSRLGLLEAYLTDKKKGLQNTIQDFESHMQALEVLKNSLDPK